MSRQCMSCGVTEQTRVVAFGVKINRYIEGLFRLPLRRIAAGDAQHHFARSVTGTLFLKTAATVLAFAVSLLLARLLGAEGYGVYAYAAAWIGLLVVPSALGFDRLVVRQVAVYHSQAQWSRMRGLINRAQWVALLVASITSLLSCAVVWFVVSSDREMRRTFWLALLLLPLLTLINLRQSIAQGLRHVVRGQLPDTLIRPTLLVLFIITAYSITDAKLSPSLAMELNIAATLITFLIGAAMLRSILPRSMKEAEKIYEMQDWLRSAPPLLLVSGLAIINAQTAVLMLGALQNVEAVGIYNAAGRMAEQITFVVGAVNFSLAPNVARLWVARDIKRLQQVVTKSVRVVFLASAPIAVVLIVFGRKVLSLFGAEFTAGYGALGILCAGQLVSTAMGSVSLLLMMTNHERDVVVAYAVSAVANLVLGALLIPKWGIEGAAVARVASLILWNALLSLRVNHRLGIRPGVFG